MPLPLLLLTPAPVQAPMAEADRLAIRQVALDYMEGWYEGDAARMERALHPDLAKRIAERSPEGVTRLNHMNAQTLIQGTQRGFGKQTPKAKQQKEVQILDLFGNAASVRATMADWIDYMHLAKFNGQWKIVNVLWERKAAPEK